MVLDVSRGRHELQVPPRTPAGFRSQKGQKEVRELRYWCWISFYWICHFQFKTWRNEGGRDFTGRANRATEGGARGTNRPNANQYRVFCQVEETETGGKGNHFISCRVHSICYVIIKIFHNFIDITKDITVYIGYSDTAGKQKKCHCKRLQQLQPYPIIFSVR